MVEPTTDKPASRKGGKRGTKGARSFSRPRGGEAKAISDLMPEIGRAAFRRYGFVQSSVVTRWPDIVGEHYAEVSAPQAIRFPSGKRSGGTLELTVSGAHATLMQHVTPEIVERVNRFFGYAAVDKLKFIHGIIEPPKDPRAKRAAAPPTLKPVPIELGEGLRDIADPELAAVLESLARQMADKDIK